MLHPEWLERLCALAKLEPDFQRDWLVFLLALHDLGKFGHGFQRNSPWAFSKALPVGMKLQERTGMILSQKTIPR